MGEDKPESVDAPSAPVTGRRLKRKYQVFVSSTYRDLSEERERVVWTILECRQIPVGMESFSATDDRGWKTIQRTIDDTDYYVLLLAGTYGSVDPSTGMSWTEREYKYAVSRGIPVLAFIRESSVITVDKSEQEPDKKKRLDALIKRVRDSHQCVDWKVADDLAKSVATSLFKQIEDDEGYGSPRSGWVRGDMLPSSAVMDEFARLSKENAILRQELEHLRAPERTAKLELMAVDREDRLEELDVRVPRHELQDKRREDVLREHIDEEKIKHYLDKLNHTVWLKARIRNTGTALAEGIVIDLKIDGVEKAVVRHEKPPYGWMGRESDSSRANGIVNIETLSPSRIRQRIMTLAPHVDEELIPMGLVVSDAALVEDYVIQISYNIAENLGAQTSGAVSIKVKLGVESVSFGTWDEVPDGAP